MVAEARGSIGGTTFARNRAGAYARNRTKPVNPSSPKQIVVRLRLSSLQTIWQQTLGSAGRAPWDAVASANPFKNKLGQASPISGFNLYLRVNALRLIPGLALATVPPTPPLELDIKGFTVTAASATGLQITAKDANFVTTDHVLIHWTDAMSQGRNFWKGPYANKTDFDGSTSIPFTLDASVAIGDRYHFRWIAFNATTNRVSAVAYGHVDCTA
jgi:hypothetical protein